MSGLSLLHVKQPLEMTTIRQCHISDECCVGRLLIVGSMCNVQAQQACRQVEAETQILYAAADSLVLEEVFYSHWTWAKRLDCHTVVLCSPS